MPRTVDLASVVAESRARCGLPPKVVDPTALRLLADMFLDPSATARRPRGRKAAA